MFRLFRTAREAEWMLSLGQIVVSLVGGTMLTAITAIFSPLWEYAGIGGVLIVFLFACSAVFAARNTFLHGYSFQPITASLAATDKRTLTNQSDAENCLIHQSIYDEGGPTLRMQLTVFFKKKTRPRHFDLYYEDNRQEIDCEEVSRNDYGMIIRVPAIERHRKFRLHIEPYRRITD